MITKKIKIGQKVKVSPDNDNECYNSFRDKVLIITHVAKNKFEHPGYDESVSPQKLYDFKTEAGDPVGCSLYDYELVEA
jgi:hypothetical protein